MTSLRKNSCLNCYYSRTSDNGLECRRYAPRPYLEPEDYVLIKYPQVDIDFWCGEWDHKSEVESND